MDQPQHQVFRSHNNSYRYMAFPPQKQPLHLLYPGRFMQRDYDFTGDNIPSEHPRALVESHMQNAALSRAAERETVAFSRHLGGRNKVVPHPAVEPEAPIEDPALTGVDLKTRDDLMPVNLVPGGGVFGASTPVPGLPPQPLLRKDKLNQVLDQSQHVEEKVRAELAANRRAGVIPPIDREGDTLRQYDWDAPQQYYAGQPVEQLGGLPPLSPSFSIPATYRETFVHGKEEVGSHSHTHHSGSSSSSDDSLGSFPFKTQRVSRESASPTFKWLIIGLVVLAVLTVIIVVVVVYEKKGKSKAGSATGLKGYFPPATAPPLSN